MKNLFKIMMSFVLIALTSTAISAVTGADTLYVAGGLFAAGFALGIAKNLFGFSTEMPKNVAYEGIAITDTTYAGEAAADFIVKAITDNAMVNGGHIYVKDGIKKKYTIPRWDANYEDFIQDVQATPVPKGEQSVTGKALNPAEYMIYHEFNPRDYEDHWFATQLPGSTLLDTSLPTNVESVLIQEVLKRHGKFVNKIIWNGDTTATTIYKYFDGLKKKATDASDTIKVGSPTTLSAANIQAEFQKGFDLIPVELKYDTGMKIFCSFATFEFYMQAQIAQTNKGVDMTQKGNNTFRGLTVVPVPDFPNDYYNISKGSAGRDSNLWMGINSTDDMNTIQLAKKQANSELYFIKLLMKADVQYGWNSETVTYE